MIGRRVTLAGFVGLVAALAIGLPPPASGRTTASVRLSESGCSFTAVASWSGVNPTNAVLRLAGSAHGGSVTNAVDATIRGNGATFSWTTGPAGSAASFQATVELWDGQPAGTGTLLVIAGSKRLNRSCALPVGN